jgi:cytidine deaminase
LKTGLPQAELAALLEAARRVRRNARAPYSGFQVGAAVRDDRGCIHVGCNLENASYGLTVCAERNAVAAAVAAGATALTAVVVVTAARRPATPCGACRQVLGELGGPALTVILAGVAGPARKAYRLGKLLPEAFTLD